MSTARIWFFNDTATTEIYTLSLHDALPISRPARSSPSARRARAARWAAVPRASLLRRDHRRARRAAARRSEEHTSELQSRQYLVCRLLLEKKKVRDQLAPLVTSLPTTTPSA